jgi:hypothetical protein
MTDVTQADLDAADAHFDIWYPDTAWGFDALAETLARHRQHAYDHGYYDGYTYLLEQHEALREALEAAPLIGRTESVNDFMARQNAWINGPYRAALEQSK